MPLWLVFLSAAMASGVPARGFCRALLGIVCASLFPGFPFSVALELLPGCLAAFTTFRVGRAPLTGLSTLQVQNLNAALPADDIGSSLTGLVSPPRTLAVDKRMLPTVP